jgi:predicted nucleic acid-binding protein
MLIIPDANAILSALIKKGKAFDLFEWNDFREELKFIAPENLSSEIKRNLPEIKSRSKLSKSEFEDVFNKIESQIEFIPMSKFSDFISEAMKLSPPNDFPYVALSLFLKSKRQDPIILSNDKELLGSLSKHDIKGLPIHELLRKLSLV